MIILVKCAISTQSKILQKSISTYSLKIISWHSTASAYFFLSRSRTAL